MTYHSWPTLRKPLVLLAGEIKTPPFSEAARKETGRLLAALQLGADLSLPHSRPLPSIGARCHELRVNDAGVTWRVIYRVDADAVLVVEVFAKKTRALPRRTIEGCKGRLAAYDRFIANEEDDDHGPRKAGAAGEGRLHRDQRRGVARPLRG